MWSFFRLFVLALLPAAALIAQEEASPTPSPTASPAPAESPSPSPTATPATAEATPTPESTPSATPSEQASPSPEASPSPSATPSEDVIPMEGSASAPLPTEGAPLETAPLVPQTDVAMPDEAFTDSGSDVPPPPPAIPSTAGSAQETARKASVRYKEVRVEAEKDPQVAEMAQRAEEAKTDEDKRAALREYYRLLFKKMISIDKSVEVRCKVMEAAYLRRLAQERLEPTIPLNPPPTPAPIGQ